MKKILLFSICLFFYSVLFSDAKAATVKINEFLANPSEGDKEFVELYSEDISDFSNYYLKDKAGTKKTLENLQNCSKYFVWELSTLNGEGWLNNTGEESIFLYDQNDNVIDSYENWKSPEEGKSLSRIPDSSGDWQETTITKCAENQAPDPTPSPQPSPTPSPSHSPTPSPTPKSTSTASPTSSKKSPSPTPLANQGQNSQPSGSPQVLGQKDLAQGFADLAATDLLNTPSPQSTTYDTPFNKNFSKILIAAGVVFIILSFGLYLWYKRSLGLDSSINKGNDRFEQKNEEE